MDVYVWLYRSVAVGDLSDQEIMNILSVARSCNKDHGITGLLLYRDGRFTQMVEGKKAEILSLKNNISCDPRHQNVETLFEGVRPERVFATWSMAFQRLDNDQQKALDAYMPIDWGQRTVATMMDQGNLNCALKLMSKWASKEPH